MPEEEADGPRVVLRDVTDGDLSVFFEHQLDPDATRMAAFPARDRQAHLAHWRKIMADSTAITQTVVVDGTVAGNIGSWQQDGDRLVGYWIGKSFWGRGIATLALARFLTVVQTRPIWAHVVRHNRGSIRVLQKCGFTAAPSTDEDPDELVLVLTH